MMMAYAGQRTDWRQFDGYLVRMQNFINHFVREPDGAGRLLLLSSTVSAISIAFIALSFWVLFGLVTPPN
jgi:hypothetical protein